MTMLAMCAWIVACAQQPATESGQSATAAAGDGPPPLEKKCKYERTNRAGSRLHRVCRYVDPADNKAAEQ